MPHSFVRIGILFFLIWSLFTIENSSVFAKYASWIQLKNSYTPLLDLTKNTKSKRLYAAWKLEIDIDSPTGAEIIIKNQKLLIWIPLWVQSGTGELVLTYKNKELKYPVEIDISKNMRDYDISKSLYKKSLQDKSLSCESSATSDIISTLLQKRVTEDDIIEKLPKSSHYNKLPENGFWGNPHEWFVGYIDHTDEMQAKQKQMTGYGVYEKPIAKVYKDYGFKTQIINRWTYDQTFQESQHLNYLLTQLSRGHMVQLWWDWCTRKVFEDGTQDSKKMSEDLTQKWISGKNECYNVEEKRNLKWKYYNTKDILVEHTWLDGEHAFILLWWKWDIQNPTHIKVWDTNTWYHMYQTEEWMRKWKKMDYRSILVKNK